jgi:DnaJ-class molecular chaperone
MTEGQREPEPFEAPCPDCGGDGWGIVNSGPGVSLYKGTCPRCGGSGVLTVVEVSDE